MCIRDSNGGVVFGAAFDDDYSVRHVRIENKENLSRIMKSKYVQSDLKYIFDVLAEDLEKGRPVLFTGTPCQVVAVCQFADGLRLREKPVSYTHLDVYKRQSLHFLRKQIKNGWK